MTEPTRHAWERREEESNDAWEAFRRYRDASRRPDPPMMRVAAHGNAFDLGDLKDWFRLHDWVERAKALDASLDQVRVRVAREAVEAVARPEAERVAETHRRVLVALSEVALIESQRLLETLHDSPMPMLRPREIFQLAETITRLHAISKGQPVDGGGQERDLAVVPIEDIVAAHKLLTRRLPQP